MEAACGEVAAWQGSEAGCVTSSCKSASEGMAVFQAACGTGFCVATHPATIILSPTLHLHGSRLVQSGRDCGSNAPPGFRKSSTHQPSSCTTHTTRPRISGARSTAPAAIYPESDCTSLAKDSERMWGLDRVGDPTKRVFYRAFRDFNPLNDLGSG